MDMFIALKIVLRGMKIETIMDKTFMVNPQKCMAKKLCTLVLFCQVKLYSVRIK